MPSFKSIDEFNQIPSNSVDYKKFNSKGRFVDEDGQAVDANYIGRQFWLVSKRERTYSIVERISRICLGIVASFGYALTLGRLISKENCKIFFLMDKEKVRYGLRLDLTLDQKEFLNDLGCETVNALGGVQKVLRIPARQREYVQELGLDMIKAFGGLEAALRIPILGDDKDITDPKNLTAPIMRYSINSEKVGLHIAFRCEQRSFGLSRITSQVISHHHGRWTNHMAFGIVLEEESSRLQPLYSSYYGQGCHHSRATGEEILLDRIRRLVNHEPVGLFRVYPEYSETEGLFKKPLYPRPDIEHPQDAYLQGDDLTDYIMRCEFKEYEQKPLKDKNELVLV